MSELVPQKDLYSDRQIQSENPSARDKRGTKEFKFNATIYFQQQHAEDFRPAQELYGHRPR